ncbi:TRAP transporter small permease [Pikeienuella piscinae]|uniref:TRAP transporter small permease protein n=1 Tax=Pikeienuella piscinae TaxID=2748098 RepID=A0A7L5BVD5_9RHOB|nr:TRAP transporter small permease [Pikeienuella piscinae]QIE55043.1 TRAP transporter small permease [Pikeienuella piscinae]
MSGAARRDPVSRALGALEVALAAVAGVAMALIMVIVAVDVAMRYFFNAPLGWSYGLIGIYLVVAVFFLSLSDTMRAHGHIALDVARPLLPRSIRHLGLFLGYGISAPFIGLIAWLALEQAISAWVGDDRIAATVPWPTWPAYALVAVGAAALALRILWRAFGHAAALATGRELADEPPASAMSDHAAEHGE